MTVENPFIFFALMKNQPEYTHTQYTSCSSHSNNLQTLSSDQMKSTHSQKQLIFNKGCIFINSQFFVICLFLSNQIHNWLGNASILVLTYFQQNWWTQTTSWFNRLMSNNVQIVLNFILNRCQVWQISM